jgi:hypothetical protein
VSYLASSLKTDYQSILFQSRLSLNNLAKTDALSISTESLYNLSPAGGKALSATLLTKTFSASCSIFAFKVVLLLGVKEGRRSGGYNPVLLPIKYSTKGMAVA